MKNYEIILFALSVSMWYNATARLYNLLIPLDWYTTILMFAVATALLLSNDGSVAELIYNFNDYEKKRGGKKAYHPISAVMASQGIM